MRPRRQDRTKAEASPVHRLRVGSRTPTVRMRPAREFSPPGDDRIRPARRARDWVEPGKRWGSSIRPDAPLSDRVLRRASLGGGPAQYAPNEARQTYRTLRRRFAERSTDLPVERPDPRTTSVIAGSRWTCWMRWNGWRSSTPS